ncbi:sensor histidine kinase [Bacillus benzoevorans]|uniref:histidine kinase n=1 Tax=Bacillus benzoevorans TaxID=1456 RepID=A0A7X0LXQ6_9BACI|nr:signal transduction histidine kinase [Bacillus benzoevorans]
MIRLDSSSLSWGIIVFSLALAFYFLLSLKELPLLLYLLLSIISLATGLLFTESVFFTMLILLYLLIDSTYSLNEKRFQFYAAINVFCIILLLWKDPNQWLPWAFISLFVSFLVLKSNSMANERMEQKEIYGELLGEYRKLKRMNLERERDARIQERTMMARDIHDSVGHRLTALLMKLEILSMQHPNSDYDDLKRMAKESLEEIRHSVKTLQTEENEGIATVVQLIRKLEAESHISVQFTMKQGILSVPLNNEKSVVLYRVIQEGLTNAMRHAGSREVQVTLGKSAIGDIQFMISNRVFMPKPFTFGFGLKNMKARIEGIKGTLEVYQTEDQFVLTGTIPNREG